MRLPPLLARDTTVDAIRAARPPQGAPPAILRAPLGDRELIFTVGLGHALGIEMLVVAEHAHASAAAEALSLAVNMPADRMEFSTPLTQGRFRYALQPITVSPFTDPDSDLGRILKGLDAPLLQTFIEVLPDGGRGGLSAVCEAKPLRLRTAPDLIAHLAAGHLVAEELLDSLARDEDDDDFEPEFVPLDIQELDNGTAPPEYAIAGFGQVVYAMDFVDIEPPHGDGFGCTVTGLRATFQVSGVVAGQIGVLLLDTRGSHLSEWAHVLPNMRYWASTLLDPMFTAFNRQARNAWKLDRTEPDHESENGLGRIMQVWMAPAFEDESLLAFMVDTIQWAAEAWYACPFHFTLELLTVSDDFTPAHMSDRERRAYQQMFAELGWPQAPQGNVGFLDTVDGHAREAPWPVYLVPRVEHVA